MSFIQDQTLVGVDLGGTKTKCGRVKNGRILQEVCLPTRSGSQENIITEDIISVIKQVMSSDVEGIGIGVPGLIDKTNGIVHYVNNIPSWKEVHLKKKLEDHFGIRVVVSNDADCFALGEKLFGKGKNYKDLVCLSLGTGVGAGIIINNQIYSGPFEIAGEFGCLPYLDHNFEYYCSGEFFKKCYGSTGKELYNRALSGELMAKKVFEEYGDHLGNLIHTILYILGPEAVIIGGSVSQSYTYFQKSMMETIKQFPFKHVTNKFVVEISVDQGIAVTGAAALCITKVD